MMIWSINRINVSRADLSNQLKKVILGCKHIGYDKM